MSIVSIELFGKYANVHSDEILMQSYLDSAQSIVENYLGYELSKKVYSDKLNGNGKREIQLRAKPIINVSKLKINNIEYDTSTLHISNEFISSQECIFLEGYRNIQVIYQAGYDIEDVYNIIDGETSVDSEKEKIIDGNGNEHTIDGGDAGQRNEAVPELIKSTILRIATLLNTESDGNIGINGSSFGESGSRTYVSYTNFDKYLYPISKYKIIRI